MSNFLDKYNKEIKPVLKEELGLKNDLALPRLKKIVINVGVGEAKDNEGLLDSVKNNLIAISGQQPVVTKAKKSISAFKLVKGQPIGVMVTLRKEKMYIFLEKLITAVLPRVRDFRGVSDKAFDSQGNYNMGLREQVIFPEVDLLMRSATRSSEKASDRVRGLQITISTSAKVPADGRRLLELFGMPFNKS